MRCFVIFHTGNNANPTQGLTPSGAWTGSTKTMKENFQSFQVSEGLEILKGLNPSKFSFKNDPSAKTHIGFIAEEVPDIIANADKNMISEMDIIAVLTAVVKNQQQEIDDLKNRVNKL